MTAKTIDGKAITQKIRNELKRRLEKRRIKDLITPGLAVILVGKAIASQIYVCNKRNACHDTGINSLCEAKLKYN